MRIIDLTCIVISAALAAAPAVAEGVSAPATSSLSINVGGIEIPKGKIMLALYDEQGWTTGKYVRAVMLDAAQTAELTTAFKDLPAGRYGVKAFHDLNGNGQMDANPFGMPTEPFAFSRDAHGAMGPAKWADAAFDVVAGDNAQRITIR